MKLAGIIQARMGSQRLPGKVLKCVNGKPLIDYLIERLATSKTVSQWIIATSVESQDDLIAEHCRKRRLECYRGPNQDVAARFCGVIRQFGLEAFVRLSADSPMLDVRLIDQAVLALTGGNQPIVSNISKRSFPRGQSVEVLKAQTFLSAYPDFSDPRHFEHVTPYFYENPGKFPVKTLTNPFGDDSGLSLCVDTQGELDHFKKILSGLEKPFTDYSWRDFLDVSKKIQKEQKSPV